MPVGSIVILSAIISAFTLFGVVLAWGDFYTRGIRKDADQVAQSRSPENRPLKKAA